MANPTTYADAGVNNASKESISKILYEAARETWANREGKLGEIIAPDNDFSGIRYVNISNLPEGTILGAGSDGIGTKVEFSERTGDYKTDAFNLLAMMVDDVPVRGGEPILVTSVLDVNSLKDKNGNERIEIAKQLTQGYVNAAKAAGVAVINGETAELTSRVSGYSKMPGFFTRLIHGTKYILSGQRISDNNFHLNWSGTAIWIANKNKLFTGRQIKEGDYLVGLLDEGFGSNGISLVRKIAEKNFGREWHLQQHGARNLGELVSVPCTIYCRALVDMYGSFNQEPRTEIHGIAHITGGGLPEKLKRVLRPSGFGAEIDNPMIPPEIMSYFQRIGNVSDREAYKTWHMGPRMVVITPKPDEVIRIATGDYGIQAENIGTITSNQGIRIKNRGAFSSKKENYLVY